MGNQIIGFMAEIADRVFKTKFLTNRARTEHRGKLAVGDTIYCYTGLRQPKCKWLGNAEVVNLVEWSTSDLPDPSTIDLHGPSLLPGKTWVQFYTLDGFDNYENLYNYFTHRKERDWLCIVFREIPRPADAIYCDECRREIERCFEAIRNDGECEHEGDMESHGWNDFRTATARYCHKCYDKIMDGFCADCETQPCSRGNECWKTPRVPYETYVADRVPHDAKRPVISPKPLCPAPVPRGQLRLDAFGVKR